MDSNSNRLAEPIEEMSALDLSGAQPKPHGSDTQDDSGSQARSDGSNYGPAGLGVMAVINQMIEDEDETEEREANGAPKFSATYIKNMLREYGHLYYPVAEINDILYLNHKGFSRFRNMDMFPDLKCLYYEGNGK